VKANSKSGLIPGDFSKDAKREIRKIKTSRRSNTISLGKPLETRRSQIPITSPLSALNLSKKAKQAQSKIQAPLAPREPQNISEAV